MQTSLKSETDKKQAADKVKTSPSSSSATSTNRADIEKKKNNPIESNQQKQQHMKLDINDNQQPSDQTMTMTARGTPDIQKNRLVFGLNSRANKAKYDQYAERRSAQESPPQQPMAITGSLSQKLQSPGETNVASTTKITQIKTQSDKENLNTTTTTTKPNFLPNTIGGIRASKFGNYYKPQDLLVKTDDTTNAPAKKPLRSTSQERKLKKSISIHDNEEPILNVDQAPQKNSDLDSNSTPTKPASSSRDPSPSAVARTRKVVRKKSLNKSDDRDDSNVNEFKEATTTTTSTVKKKNLKDFNESGPPITSTIPSSKTKPTIPKSKSQDDKSIESTQRATTITHDNKARESQTRSTPPTNLNTKTSTNLTAEPNTNDNKVNNEPGTPITTTRLQFNIPPPPRQVSSSKSNVVDYAKSKIYDSPKHPNNINKASLNAIPNIVSCFKPPKVNVSKAREKWEGGEPFILANNRRQRNFVKKNLLGTWSVTSVVAAQQNQFQQALESNSTLVNAQNTQKSSVKQMLARGSVLERVQQFEKTPSEESLDELQSRCSTDDPKDLDKTVDLQSSKQASYKSRISLASDTSQDLLVNKSESPVLFRRGSLRRQSSSSVRNKIPRFYHPDGKPNTYEIEIQNKNIAACFDKFPERKAPLFGPSKSKRFHAIALACGFSEYYKEPLYLYVCHQLKEINLKGNSNGTKKGMAMRKATSVDTGSAAFGSGEQKYITCDQFLVCWRKVISSCYDAAARFVHIMTLGQRKYLIPEDFVPLLQSVIEDHPGLSFLRAAPDFHMRYIQTVVARIFFCINKSWTGKITLTELRRSNLLPVLSVLSQEDDINQITDYFSYEHFYVIYCKFWTLDQDHDLFISKDDLARHNDAAISSRIIDRIFLGTVSKQVSKTGKLSYSEFVWFLIAEEDKKYPRSIEYWFRLMDLDGDGFISMYEMEYFYYEQMKRLELMGIEALPFQDCACQILDLVNPKTPNKITLSDLKRSRMTPIFFDTFINLEKYLEHESREFASTRDATQDGVVISDWDRYAAEEYELLVSEEGATSTTSTATLAKTTSL